MGTESDLFGSTLFEPAVLFGSASQPPINSQVRESIARITAATLNLEPGWHGAVDLSPYKQLEPDTCFFTGPLSLARDYLGIVVSEHLLAVRARQFGLLDEKGATTTDAGKRISIEEFVLRETGIAIKFHQPSWGEEKEDLLILRILTERGNLASVLYPQSDASHEWETFFGVTKVAGEAGVRWSSNFSPTGVIKQRSTPKMATLLYGRPQNPYLLICELKVQTPLSRT